MAGYAAPKYPYAVWDGTNLAEIQVFLPSAHTPGDGSLWVNAGVADYPIAGHTGMFIVAKNDPYTADVFESEADFLARYSSLS